MPAHRGRRSNLQERARAPAWARELLERFRSWNLAGQRSALTALRWLVAEVQALVDQAEVGQAEVQLADL